MPRTYHVTKKMLYLTVLTAISLIIFCSPSIANGLNLRNIGNYAGPEYNFDYFNDMSIADFKLMMTEAEVREIIKRDGWTGGWVDTPVSPPETIETTGYTFKKGLDQAISLYRYKTADDDSYKIYAIEFAKKFPASQDMSIITQRLFERYGEPTNIKRDGVNIVFEYSPDNKMSGVRDCQTVSQQKQPKCFLYVSWLKGPRMTIKIGNKGLEMVLENENEALTSQTTLNARKGIFVEQLKKREAENFNLDF
ncbi:MAG: hypothetical protein RBR86_03405 [Pseudobdellovibrionaceae bacterium]|nr:hypothetical protein [Pseudobdellovibrionaceae bacterium]